MVKYGRIGNFQNLRGTYPLGVSSLLATFTLVFFVVKHVYLYCWYWYGQKQQKAIV
jgi:hypothetical protein